MMMMEADEEGSPMCRLNEEDFLANDVVFDLDELLGFAEGGPHDLPQDSRLDELHYMDALTAMRTSEEVTWTEEVPGFGIASPQHNFEASEYRRACSDGIVDSAWNPSISNSERLEPSSRFSQADDLLDMPEVCWAKDEIPGVGLASPKDNLKASEPRRSLSDGFGEPSLDSHFTYGEMLEPSSQLSQGNGLFYMHAYGGSQNAIAPCQNNSEKAPIETFNQSEGFNCYGANHIMNNQQSSNQNVSNKAPFDTPNYGEVSSFHRFNHVIHKQDSSNFSLLNHEDYLFNSVIPSMGNESKKHSNSLPNEFSKTKGHIKEKKNIKFVSSRDIVSRASDKVDNAIYGGPCVSSTNEGIKLSSSKCLPLVSCENHAYHLKDETEDNFFESSSADPSLGMVGDTPVKNSDDVAHYGNSVVKVSENPGVLPPIKMETVKLENEVTKLDDSCLSKINYRGVQNNILKQSNVDDDSDLCILENMSTPARSIRIAMGEKLIGAKQILTSRDPGNQMVAAQAKRKPNNERAIYRVALQDLSQPKSEATPPSGLSVPLLKHQRIALSWMANKETKSACCSGGILADDQGLGKTISTIALILKERSPSSKALKTNEKERATETLNLDDDVDDGVSETYRVIEGAKPLRVDGYSIPMQAKGRPSGGTLVVCPTSVLRQWSEELHCKVTSEADLSVLVYYGSNRTKDPVELAKYDVVVTTYAIVSMEVPKQPVVNENEDQRGSPYKDSSSCGKRKTIGTHSDKKSCTNKKSKKGIDNEVHENVSGPLAQVGWFRVVLDEAQSIKNHRTQAARACWGLRAKRRWCLSGTPIQNAIDDLYSYFRFLRHEPYAVFRIFCEQLKVPIHKNPRNGYKKLQAVLKTIMLRRTKGTFIDGEPIINLPPKTIELRKIDFSMEERDFYSRLEAASRAQFAEYAAAGTVKQNYVNILLMLLRLRQACDHPLLVKGLNSNANMASSIEMAKKLSQEKQSSLLSCLEASLAICGICNDPPEDAVVTVCGHVFCNQCICEHITGDDTQCPTKKCKTHLTKSCVFSITTLRSAMSDQLSVGNAANCLDSQVGEVSEPRTLSCPQGSSKIRAALDLLLSLSRPQDCAVRTNSSEHTNSKEENRTSEEDMGREPSGSVKGVGEKAIVFSQWTGMLDLLEACLKSSSIQYRRLDGTMAVVARDRAVKDFNSLPEVSVIIMSLKAASLGLNMVAACNVLLLDLWWNPTTEDQAIDRAHRIGQRRPVSVFRLTVKDTVEDRILALQQKKRKMVAYAFGEDETGTRQSRLTVDDLKYLFRVV